MQGSIVTSENDYIENSPSDNELPSDNVEQLDDTSTDSIHDDSDSIECNVCGKLYKRKAHLLRHLLLHKSENDDQKKRHNVLVCKKCGKRFNKSATLESHLNDGTCEDRNVRRMHWILEVKNEKRKFWFQNPRCRFCKETFSEASDLEDHLTKIHPADRPHLCPICKKSFQSVSNRNTHLQSHNKGKSIVEFRFAFKFWCVRIVFQRTRLSVTIAARDSRAKCIWTNIESPCILSMNTTVRTVPWNFSTQPNLSTTWSHTMKTRVRFLIWLLTMAIKIFFFQSTSASTATNRFYNTIT